ncbi:MAG: hypothetical protein J0I47_04775 [Sphingomonas sp.]|uniref:sensor histidine kinase n=1 Tax=Sphingomonas sp. TaxID=28214 RepID=UPI001AC07EF7|nr:ATP-binding protein [Sphingomonas sp.]MBN8807538.1 hypothetical protein [Sphingomonas sp.]
MRRLWPRSLFGQLVLSQLTLLLILALLLPVLVLVILHRTANEYDAAQLRHDADVVAVAAVAGPSGTDVAAGQLGPLYGERGSRAYRVSSASGRIIAQGGATGALPPSRDRDAELGYSQTGKYDTYRRAVDLPGGRAIVETAQDRTRPEVIVDDVVAAFLERAFWIIPVILVASAALTLLLVARVTRQLRGVSRQADRIRPATLGTRLDTTGLPMEAQGLAAATNRALDRVEAGYRRQSEFVSSVAHELRTPLTLVALRCDALPPSPERDALRQAIDQASHVVAQLMELASIEGLPPTIEPIDLQAVAEAAVAAMAPIVFRSGRSIEMSDRRAPVPVLGHAGLLHIAIANLIDNAVRHTPPGTAITVETGRSDVTIVDDGPGIVIERKEDSARYRSAGQQRSDSAGLGLSIVARIMEAMGGRLDVASNAPGARVVLHVAAAD